MRRITTLGNQPKQKITFILEDNTQVEFRFYYKANQLGWFFGFSFNGNDYENIRLTTSLNVLRAYRNWLHFGLMCNTSDGLEPMGIEDFSNGYADLYVLNEEDMNYLESKYYAKN